MTDPVPYYRAFVEGIINGNHSWVVPALASENIRPLLTFIENWATIQQFYSTFVTPHDPQVVICGINPGKDGAGQTGIPFLDFPSLSKCLPSISKGAKKERSATFFYPVIEHFGVAEFYKHFYVTNISCIGFEDLNGNNVNYPLIANNKVKDLLYHSFASEIARVNPHTIVALGAPVQSTVQSLKDSKVLDDKIQIVPLHHPNYSAFPRHAASKREEYIEVLSGLLENRP